MRAHRANILTLLAAGSLAATLTGCKSPERWVSVDDDDVAVSIRLERLRAFYSNYSATPVVSEISLYVCDDDSCDIETLDYSDAAKCENFAQDGPEYDYIYSDNACIEGPLCTTDGQCIDLRCVYSSDCTVDEGFTDFGDRPCLACSTDAPFRKDGTFLSPSLDTADTLRTDGGGFAVLFFGSPRY